MELWKNKKWLEEEYSKHGMSAIAKICNKDNTTILYWLRKFNIPIRTISQSLKITDKKPDRKGKNDYFSKIDSHEKAYWLGFLMADGTMLENRYKQKCNQVCFELAQKDSNMVHAFAQAIGYKGKICDDKIRSRFSTTNYQLTKDLIGWGIVPRKTGKEQIPDIEKEFLPDFIRGFFDGDGSIMFKESSNRVRVKFEIVCMNKKMLNNIKEIFVKNANIKESTKIVHPINHNNPNKKTIYAFETSNMGNIYKIYNYIYNDFTFMPRKKKIFDSFVDYYLNRSQVAKRYSPNCLETNRAKQK